MKGTYLFFPIFLSATCSNGMGQAPERMLNAKSANARDPSEKAISLYNKGHDHFGKKEYALAIQNYEEAIKVDSEYIDAYNNLGLVFYEAGNQDSAAYYLEHSLKLFPAGTTAMQNLALVEEKKGNLEKALTLYKKIEVADHDNPEGFYNAARIMISMAKFDEALGQAETAEKLYKKSNIAYIGDCHYLILLIYYNTKNKPMAKKYLDLCNKEGFQVPTDIASDLK